MTQDTVFLIVVAISIAFFPALAFYYRWKVGWDAKRKQRKIAEFIEKAAEKQVQAKDGPK